MSVDTMNTRNTISPEWDIHRYLNPGYILPEEAKRRDRASPEAIALQRGIDLRLLPIACMVWTGVSASIITRNGYPTLFLISLGTIAFALLMALHSRSFVRELGHYMPKIHAIRGIVVAIFRSIAVASTISAIASCVVQVKINTIENNPLIAQTRATGKEEFSGDIRVTGIPKLLDSGTILIPATVVSSDIGPIPIFIAERYQQQSQEYYLRIHPGSILNIEAQLRLSDRADMVPINAQVTAEPRVLAGSEPRGVDAVTAWLREGFRHSTESLPWRTGELVPGIVMGDTSRQSVTMQQDFIDTGLSHLTAVSGANVAIVAGCVVTIASFLGVSIRRRAYPAIVVVLFFAVLVGLEPSVLRATAMGIVGLVSILSSRWQDVLATLCAVIIILLFFIPSIALSYAFILSVSATVGIIALAPIISKKIAQLWWMYRYRQGHTPRHWEALVIRTVSVACVADLVTIPIIIHMNGRIPLSTVIANLLVTPAVPIITIAGVIVAPIAAIANSIGVPDTILTLCALPTAPGAAWIIYVAENLSRFPQLEITGGYKATISAASMVVLIALSVARTRWILTLRWIWLAVGVCIIIAVRNGSVGFANHPQPAYEQWRAEDLHGRRIYYVENEEEAIRAGEQANTVIIVMECGKHPDRPSLTPSGVPVLYQCPQSSEKR